MNYLISRTDDYMIWTKQTARPKEKTRANPRSLRYAGKGKWGWVTLKNMSVEALVGVYGLHKLVHK